MPKYKQLNWISISMAQRTDMPPDTKWVGNIYHGLAADAFTPNFATNQGYVAYLGRIIESKGVHLAIAAAKQAGVKLKMAGKHYAGHSKDAYWQQQIEPQIDGKNIEYVGFVKGHAKQDLLANASALLVPSTFEEPFGMVLIEALACGTPVIGLGNGAIGEIIKNGQTGFVVPNASNDTSLTQQLAQAINNVDQIDRKRCRADFEKRFTLKHMCQKHFDIYKQLL
jgi:glycosyltransferase involved in cell wall biosynthesis